MLYLHLIWRQLKIVGLHLYTIGKIVWSWAKSNPLLAGSTAIVLVVAIGALAYFFGGSAATPTLSDTRSVTLIRVGDVSESAPLSLIGTVRATREANVAPDISGTVAAVYRSLGDYVGAGTILAELKNDTQRASVAQARAALQKTQSAVAVGGIGVESAETSYAAAQDTARATIQTAFATIDDTVSRKADDMFSNPGSAQPHFNVSSSNSQLVGEAESGRLAMQPILTRHSKVELATMSAEQLQAELTLLASEIKIAQAFMQDVVGALNGAVATYSITDAVIDGYR
ncbi:MAG: biotin/lipoyl-binding protein, partial [Patescibacteria group bacterium]